MNSKHWLRAEVAASVSIALALLCGCTASTGTAADRGRLGWAETDGARETPLPERGLRRAEEEVRGGGAGTSGSGSARRTDTPVALVGGQPVTCEALRAALLEYGGGIIVEELALDLALSEEAVRRGVSVSDADARREEQLLRQSLGRNAAAAESQAAELVGELRRTRGLGEARFSALLRRSALLRALIRERVAIPEPLIEQVYRIRHGERFVIRIITTENERDATHAAEALNGLSGAELAARFAELARGVSKDPSAVRGGQIEALSPVDPSYPSSLRSVLERTAVGAITPVIALDRGYALALLEQRLPPSGVTLPAVEGDIREEVRRRQERLEMDRLAQELMSRAQVTPLDPALRWSWERRPSTTARSQ
ncbi:MAG: peptidylprolyl isomerase [Phycisphaerae bacterium]|nr:peptidylprolyl isomerase [Phycisphaerae bacterium]